MFVLQCRVPNITIEIFEQRFSTPDKSLKDPGKLSDLTILIFRFQDFTGEDLMQLKRMLLAAPECYYTTLRDNLKMSLLHMLRFTKVLQEL